MEGYSGYLGGQCGGTRGGLRMTLSALKGKGPLAWLFTPPMQVVTEGESRLEIRHYLLKVLEFGDLEVSGTRGYV